MFSYNGSFQLNRSDVMISDPVDPNSSTKKDDEVNQDKEVDAIVFNNDTSKTLSGNEHRSQKVSLESKRDILVRKSDIKSEEVIDGLSNSNE